MSMRRAEARQPARLGRPPALSPEDRRHALISAAGRVFLRDGFAGATMEQIAAEAGMSKRTLYKFFSDKRMALEALLGAHDHRPPLSPYAHRPGDDPRQELRRTLLSLLAYLLDPMQIALTRLVIAEVPQFPELTAVFERLELGGVSKHVAVRFQRLRDDGAIAVDDLQELADLMIGALIGAWHIAALAANDAKPPPRAAVEARVDKVIAVFAGPLGLSPGGRG